MGQKTCCNNKQQNSRNVYSNVLKIFFILFAGLVILPLNIYYRYGFCWILSGYKYVRVGITVTLTAIVLFLVIISF